MSVEWISKFNSQVADVGDGLNFNQAAAKLRQLIQTNLLTLTDITDNPERFFLAHKLLSNHSTRLGPGFSIRFTVHYNLFAGTVVGLGSDEQVQNLVNRNAKNPRLGCFALTEVLAGVNSGLVVETTAKFVNGKFIINTPNDGAQKNWISQGLVADEGVVVASLEVNGKKLGPQAFLVNLRNDDGSLVKGFSVKDMGIKTVGNDLDNGRLRFTNFEAPLDSLLCRYLTVDKNGNVGFPQGNTRTMDMIGQRLFSGRICVGQAALEFAKSLFKSTKQFCEKKPCWSPSGPQFLINVPQVSFVNRSMHCSLKLTNDSNFWTILCKM